MKTLKEFFLGAPNGVIYADTLRPSGNLGIPRDMMPQIPKVAYKKFIAHILDLGITVEEIENCPTGAIKLTQSDVDLMKVRKMIDALDGLSISEIEPSFIVSGDFYLLDGHHRFLAWLYSGETYEVPVTRIGIDIRNLISIAHKFMEDYDKNKPKEQVQESVGALSMDEQKHYRGLRKAYREMSYYQHKARNPKTPYAKKKFMESYLRWCQAVKSARKMFEIEKARGLIDLAMKRIESRIALAK